MDSPCSSGPDTGYVRPEDAPNMDDPARDAGDGRGEAASALIDGLVAEMKAVFGERQELVDHTLEVLAYAERLLQEESGDARVVRAAAALHDIGIPEALRRHGSKAGLFQEREGPPIAEAILEKHGVEREAVEHISRIIGSHHSGTDIDTPEFRIVWDADGLANFPRLHGASSPDTKAGIIEETFRTETGRALARHLFTAPA